MDISQILNQLTNSANQAGQSLQTKLTADNAQSPSGLMELQFLFFQYTSLMMGTSSFMKTFRDLVSSILSKI